MKEITQEHIEVGPTIFKRVRVVGKTLCRVRPNGTRFTDVVNGEIVDDPFTIVHVEDVATGEKYDFNIRHLTAGHLLLNHLIVDEALYPGNGNIVEDYSDKPELCKEYEATFRWIPEGAEYQDKKGAWHKYRKCNRYKLEIAIAAPTKEDAAGDLFEFMQGSPYDGTNASEEDQKLYDELLDIAAKWEDKKKRNKSCSLCPIGEI